MTKYENIREKLEKANFTIYEYGSPTYKTTNLSGIERFESWFKYNGKVSVLVEVYANGKAEMFVKSNTLNLKK